MGCSILRVFIILSLLVIFSGNLTSQSMYSHRVTVYGVDAVDFAVYDGYFVIPNIHLLARYTYTMYMRMEA